MSKFSYSIEINRPVEQVFAYLNDPANLTRWIGGLVEATPITHDGPGVGAQMRQVVEENGQRIEMLEETLVYEPNRRVKIKGTGEGFDLTVDYTLHDIGGRTRLDFSEEVNMKQFFMKLIDPFFAKSARKKLTEDLARLKTQIEAQ